MFKEAVREHRHALVLTQEELAERARVSVRCIGKIETGRVAQPRQSTLRQLADALELSGEERSRFCRLAQASDRDARRRGASANTASTSTATLSASHHRPGADLPVG